MLKTRVNMETELRRERSGKRSRVFVQQIEGLLNEIAGREEEITGRIRSGRAGRQELSAIIPELDHSKIFSEKDIRRVCIDYRLRFLDSRLFVGELPHEAVFAVRKLEEKYGIKLSDLRIMAPSELFRLEDRMKDPLLFAALGNGLYYLVYKWGNDLHAWRRWLFLPFRNIVALALTCILLAVAGMIAMPAEWLAEEGARLPVIFFYKTFFGFIITGLFFTSSVIYGIVRQLDFSEGQWNSRFFN